MMMKLIKFLGVLLLLCWLAGCSYTTKSPSGNEYTVIQQPSLTSAPGLTSLEVNGEYRGTWQGNSFIGELAGGASGSGSYEDNTRTEVYGAKRRSFTPPGHRRNKPPSR